MAVLSEVFYVTRVGSWWEAKRMYTHESVQFISREAAEQYAVRLAQSNPPSEVRVHRADGSFDYSRTFG